MDPAMYLIQAVTMILELLEGSTHVTW